MEAGFPRAHYSALGRWSDANCASGWKPIPKRPGDEQEPDMRRDALANDTGLSSQERAEVERVVARHLQ